MCCLYILICCLAYIRIQIFISFYVKSKITKIPRFLSKWHNKKHKHVKPMDNNDQQLSVCFRILFLLRILYDDIFVMITNTYV